MLSNTLGKRLKMLRKQHNLNQLELSKKLSIQRQTLSAYERGISVPNIFILIQLADIYGLTLDAVSYTHLSLAFCFVLLARHPRFAHSSSALNTLFLFRREASSISSLAAFISKNFV